MTRHIHSSNRNTAKRQGLALIGQDIELATIPDDRILQIYNSLRPFRSTKAELLQIADELENKYGALINAGLVREAAEVYEKRKKLRSDD